MSLLFDAAGRMFFRQGGAVPGADPCGCCGGDPTCVGERVGHRCQTDGLPPVEVTEPAPFAARFAVQARWARTSVSNLGEDDPVDLEIVGEMGVFCGGPFVTQAEVVAAFNLAPYEFVVVQLGGAGGGTYYAWDQIQNDSRPPAFSGWPERPALQFGGDPITGIYRVVARFPGPDQLASDRCGVDIQGDNVVTTTTVAVGFTGAAQRAEMTRVSVGPNSNGEIHELLTHAVVPIAGLVPRVGSPGYDCRCAAPMSGEDLRMLRACEAGVAPLVVRQAEVDALPPGEVWRINGICYRLGPALIGSAADSIAGLDAEAFADCAICQEGGVDAAIVQPCGGTTQDAFAIDKALLGPGAAIGQVFRLDGVCHTVTGFMVSVPVAVGAVDGPYADCAACEGPRPRCVRVTGCSASVTTGLWVLEAEWDAFVAPGEAFRIEDPAGGPGICVTAGERQEHEPTITIAEFLLLVNQRLASCAACVNTLPGGDPDPIDPA